MSAGLPSTEAGTTAIGIDVGGTKIMGVVTTVDGSLLERLKEPTPKDPDHVADGIRVMAEMLVEAASQPVGIGVGLPGIVDRNGVLHYAPNLPGVVGLDVTDVLRQSVDLPVAVENDASCAAVAEHRLGAARGHRDVVMVTIGTGIGGGLIINDELVRGANGFAGEPGHMLIDRNGPVCACGTQGCWEAVASGAGLANLARMLIAEGKGQRMLEIAGGEGALLRGEHIAQAFAEGDPGAAETIDRFAWWVAQGLASLVSLLDPSIIVLGGGLIALSDAFLPDVNRQLFESVLGRGHRPRVPVVAAELGPESGAIGASLLGHDLAGSTGSSRSPRRP